MDIEIHETGNGQEIHGEMTIIRKHDHCHVRIGEYDLAEVIARHSLGKAEGVVRLGRCKLTWQTED